MFWYSCVFFQDDAYHKHTVQQYNVNTINFNNNANCIGMVNITMIEYDCILSMIILSVFGWYILQRFRE